MSSVKILSLLENDEIRPVLRPKNSAIQKDTGKDLTQGKQTSLSGYLHPTGPELNNECSCNYTGHIT